MNAVVARVLMGVTVAAAAAVLAGPAPAQVAGGLLLGLVLPGLAVTATLFRGRQLTAVERTVLAPALSLAVLVVAGLLIYVAGYALNRPAWAGATAGVTLLGLIMPAIPLPRQSTELAEAREAEIRELAAAAKLATQNAARPVGEQRVRMTTGDTTMVLPAVPAALPPLRTKEKPPLKRIARQLLPMILVAAVLTGAGWLSFTSSHHSYDIRVTALSAALPSAPDSDGNRTVAVTVSGLTAADGPYRITVVKATGTETVKVTGTSPSTTVTVTVPSARTTINLFRAKDTTTAYRTLYVAATQTP